VWTNRSKESITLDIKDPEAREVLGELVSRADVLVQNLAPGATARLGLDYETLSVKHPRLIVCDISGYGNSGPYVDKKAYDLLIQSESGFLSVTGTAAEPCKAGIRADISAECMPTAAYSPPCCNAAARGRVRISTCRCSRPRWNG
jgi:formyl-CoA transferase